MSTDAEVWACYVTALHEQTSEGDPPMPRSGLYAAWLRAYRFALFTEGRCSYAEAARRAGIVPSTMTAALSRHSELRELAEWVLGQGSMSIQDAIHEGWGESGDDAQDEPHAAIARLRSRPWIEDEVADLRRGEAPSSALLAEWDAVMPLEPVRGPTI